MHYFDPCLGMNLQCCCGKKKGKFTLYKGDETAEIDFEFETENVCAVHLNLFNAIEATKTIAAATDKIRMDILGNSLLKNKNSL